MPITTIISVLGGANCQARTLDKQTPLWYGSFPCKNPALPPSPSHDTDRFIPRPRENLIITHQSPSGQQDEELSLFALFFSIFNLFLSPFRYPPEISPVSAPPLSNVGNGSPAETTPIIVRHPHVLSARYFVTCGIFYQTKSLPACLSVLYLPALSSFSFPRSLPSFLSPSLPLPLFPLYLSHTHNAPF